jgi:hypothetical protein
VAWVIIVGALLGAVTAIRRFFWPTTRKVVHITEIWPAVEEVAGMASDLRSLVALIPTVTRMAGEFQNNGGTSLRDQADRTVRTVERVERKLTDVSQQLVIHTDEDERRFAALGRALNLPPDKTR